MSLAAAISRPRSVERGVSTTLTLTITDTLTGTVQTPSAATVAIYDSSTVILAATAATTLGAGGYSCTYALSAATIPDSIRLTDQWLEVWTLTIGGVSYTFRMTGYLCRHAYHPTLTDSDLTLDETGNLRKIIIFTDGFIVFPHHHCRIRLPVLYYNTLFPFQLCCRRVFSYLFLPGRKLWCLGRCLDLLLAIGIGLIIRLDQFAAAGASCQ